MEFVDLNPTILSSWAGPPIVEDWAGGTIKIYPPRAKVTHNTYGSITSEVWVELGFGNTNMSSDVLWLSIGAWVMAIKIEKSGYVQEICNRSHAQAASSCGWAQTIALHKEGWGIPPPKIGSTMGASTLIELFLMPWSWRCSALVMG